MILFDFFDICDSFRNPKFPLESWVHLALVVFGLFLELARKIGLITMMKYQNFEKKFEK